ncbi:hypothetical protein UFOVP435_9 [uncultured Caudovirales phage]|uniref:Uncharacterized protein n=1 Tax=uncultured Caudovirales phage TaxID=2100421 RepID=A0A6J5MBF7_9CAUD|nr:hypothetical protein UFOVP435_9 [uncultured Caudovirales phage]
MIELLLAALFSACWLLFLALVAIYLGRKIR